MFTWDMIFLLINIFLDFVMRSDMFMERCLEIQHFFNGTYHLRISVLLLICFSFPCYRQSLLLHEWPLHVIPGLLFYAEN